MRFTEKWISVVLALVMAFVSVQISALNVKAEESDVGVLEVTWSTVYETCDEMIADSDLIVYGKVVEQTSEVLDDGLVYTINTVEVMDTFKGSENDTILIYQNGGNNPEKSTPFPKELPKLEMDTPCVFFCVAGNTGYWIAGAGQGVFDGIVFETWNDIIERCRESFQNPLEVDPIGRATPETPTNGWAFSRQTSSIAYTIYGYSNLVPSSSLAAFKNGITMWNAHVPMTIYESGINSGARVIVTIQNSQNSNPNVLAGTFPDGENIRNVYCYLESIVNFGYLNNTTIWQRLGVHEMGHAIGLGHNTGTTLSVMYPYVQSQADDPQPADIYTINGLYY